MQTGPRAEAIRICRGLLLLTRLNGLHSEMKDMFGHSCTPDCRLAEIKEFPEVFYCLDSGNVHFCGDKRCSLALMEEGGFVCPVSGRVLSIDMVAAAPDELVGCPSASIERDRKSSQKHTLEQRNLEQVAREIEAEKARLDEMLMKKTEHVSADKLEVYRSLIAESVLASPVEAASDRASDQAPAKPLLSLKQRLSRLSGLRSQWHAALAARHSISGSGGGTKVPRGAVVKRLMQLRELHQKKIRRRKYIARQLKKEISSDASVQQGPLATGTRMAGPMQRKKIIGPYQLRTKRIQRKATKNYMNDIENAKSDARKLLQRLLEISAAHFRASKVDVDPTPSENDIEYAVDRCATLWFVLLQTKMFANCNANQSQSYVFLHVFFSFLREGCEYKGVFECKKVQFFASRFMQIGVLSRQKIRLEKNAEFRAKNLTSTSSFVCLALKEKEEELAVQESKSSVSAEKETPRSGEDEIMSLFASIGK